TSSPDSIVSRGKPRKARKHWKCLHAWTRNPTSSKKCVAVARRARPHHPNPEARVSSGSGRAQSRRGFLQVMGQAGMAGLLPLGGIAQLLAAPVTPPVVFTDVTAKA